MKQILSFFCSLLLIFCLSLSLSSSAFAEEGHIHSFEFWDHDELSHWKCCSCGQTTDIEKHSMVWKNSDSRLKELLGLKKGVCSVCGLEIQHSGERLRPLLRDRKFLLLLLFFAFLVGLIVTIVVVNLGHDIKSYLRHLRRRRRHRHHHHSSEKPAEVKENDGASS